jgi:hypothetical protein
MSKLEKVYRDPEGIEMRELKIEGSEEEKESRKKANSMYQSVTSASASVAPENIPAAGNKISGTFTICREDRDSQQIRLPCVRCELTPDPLRLPESGGFFFF